MDDGLVAVYSKATGKKTRVPAHWLTHPKFAGRFSKTPKQNAADTRAAGTPSTGVVSSTPPASTTPPTTSTTETPAAGAKE